MNSLIKLGEKTTHYKSIDSTQKEIWRKIQNKTIENGEVIIADIQTEGIGTHGRKWHTDEENNIAFSFGIILNKNIKLIENLTYEIAEIFTKILKNKYNIKIKIKIPNDLMIENKKIGGILTETKLQGEIIKYLVIGIGINTNTNKFNKEIENTATSIKKEFNITVNNKKIIKEFLKEFEKNINERIRKEL